MSITIFESFEDSYENYETAEEFNRFKDRVKLVYHDHNIPLVFTNYRECNEDWIQDDTLNFDTFFQDAIFRHMSSFDMFLGVFSKVITKGECQILKYVFRAYDFFQDFKMCTMFIENDEESATLAKLKRKLSEKTGNSCCEFWYTNHLGLEFILQLRSIKYYDETEIKSIDGVIWLDSMRVCNTYEVPYLDGRKQYSEILDVIQFCIKLQPKYYYLDQFYQVTTLLKQNRHEEVDSLLSYKQTHAEVKRLVKCYDNNEVITDEIRKQVFISIDKLKIIALNSLVLNYENPNRKRDILKFYKERCELAANTYMPTYVVIQTTLDYAQAIFAVKQYKRAIGILERYIEQHIKQKQQRQSEKEHQYKLKYRGMRQYSDFTRGGHSISDTKTNLSFARLQETLAMYYMARKVYGNAADMYLATIKSYSKVHIDNNNYRSKITSLYSKLGAIYEIEIKQRVCLE